MKLKLLTKIDKDTKKVVGTFVSCVAVCNESNGQIKLQSLYNAIWGHRPLGGYYYKWVEKDNIKVHFSYD